MSRESPGLFAEAKLIIKELLTRECAIVNTIELYDKSCHIHE